MPYYYACCRENIGRPFKGLYALEIPFRFLPQLLHLFLLREHNNALEVDRQAEPDVHIHDDHDHDHDHDHDLADIYFCK